MRAVASAGLVLGLFGSFSDTGLAASASGSESAHYVIFEIDESGSPQPQSYKLVRLAELLRDAELLGKRLPLRYLMIVGDALRGWLDVCEGSARGIERIVQSVARSRTEGESLHLTYTLLRLARARGLVDELQEGRAATREALSLSHRYNQRYLEGELWRVDGELAYRLGESDATASLRRAVEVAEAQGASRGGD